jgi:hypothetical protein
MEFIYIQYRIRTQDGRELLFRLRFDPRTFEMVESTPANPPAWTALEYHKCSHCPLSADTHPYCPAALRLAPAMQACENYDAYIPVHVEVTSPERTVVSQKPLQKALASLFGLALATSGCPHTAPLRPMARFHLPFATEDETLARITSMYLLAQVMRQKNGQEPDFELEHLMEVYRRLQTVNETLADRLKAGGIKPALAQAIVPLDLLSHSMPLNIRDSLERIRHIFEPLMARTD